MTEADNLNRILDRAQSHKAAAIEYDYAAKVLSETGSDAIRLKCLLILRREASSHRQAVVYKLLESENPDLKEEAFRFLVRDISRAELCLTDMIESLLDSDGDEFLCLAALQLAGEAYRQTKDVSLLNGIMLHLGSPREAFRSSASDSLVTALADEYENMSPAARFKLKRDANLDQYLIKAQSRL